MKIITKAINQFVILHELMLACLSLTVFVEQVEHSFFLRIHVGVGLYFLLWNVGCYVYLFVVSCFSFAFVTLFD